MGKGDSIGRKSGSDGMERKLRKLVGSDEPALEPESFARCYQLEALEMAKKRNTIVFLDTGAGKTLIAVMLIRSYAYFIRKPSECIAVFLVPTVVLVQQQADVLEMHTDLKVGKFWGEMGVDFWNAEIWKEKLEEFEVFVMTPQILLNNLRHTFVKLDQIKLLIFDECHHAKGKDPYACIMSEFYHPQISLNPTNIPRIFGMTASLTNTKGSSSSVVGKQISDLETLMNSKVYTVAHESVLAEYISFPNPKIKLYDHLNLPDRLSQVLVHLETLKVKHEKALRDMDFDTQTVAGLMKKISKLCATFSFCLKELGLWLTIKACDSLSTEGHATIFWGQSNDRVGEQIVRKFSRESSRLFSESITAGWSIGDDLKADVEAGYLTTKVSCLVLSLLEYRKVLGLRCIVFVERVVTAIVLQSLLSNLKELSEWGIQYMAGSRPGLQSQTRNQQLNIVDAFRDGKVNVIIATQILEEGLDVQSCNLVVRFDPAANVCSFIQSRGRARMQGSDYVLIVRRDDSRRLSQVQTFLNSGDIMRGEALNLAPLPCIPLKGNEHNHSFRVASTGSVVNLNSSVALIYFYCSRLPSDGYFKPHPRFEIDEDSDTCTLLLPKSCPVQIVRVEGICSMIRQIVCLEACKKLHQFGALSDHLIPVIDDATEDVNERGGDQACTFDEDIYFPAELVSSWSSFCNIGLYHSYKISMSSVYFESSLCDILLVVKSDLGSDFSSNSFNLETSSGSITVKISYFGDIRLDHEQIFRSRRFQVSILSLLIHQNYDKFLDALHLCMEDASEAVVYLLIPSVNGVVDWACVDSPTIYLENRMLYPEHTCSPKLVPQLIQINNECICRCMLHHSVVYTPHNGQIYCIIGILDEMGIDSSFRLRSGEISTYRRYFFTRYGLRLKAGRGPLLAAKRLFVVHNFLLWRSFCNKKVSTGRVVELPAELCIVLMSPISVNSLHTFSFIPSVMHRFQSMLLASRLRKIQLGHCREITTINPLKILEAITTRKCREEFSLESFETVGDSFLKYVTTRYLFKTYKHYHQGLLTARRERMISNSILCRLGRSRHITGFIRTEAHEPKEWIIPGQNYNCTGDHMPFTMALPNIYSTGKRFIKTKVIADSVEALIGTYLISAGEVQALSFLKWLGLDINDCKQTSIERPVLPKPELYVNVKDLQLLFNYTFHDPSLLVEALTHGSYLVSAIPRCYQRLEFLGDAVLDYLITMQLYNDYPGATPGLLTDLRSASVNNDCFAHAAAKAGLGKHILHASSELHRHMTFYLNNITSSFSGSSAGWDAGVALPKVLADVIESIAGAIYEDSGCNEEIVWASIRPLLEPLVNPNTMEIHPVRELEELCSKNSYTKSFSPVFTGGLVAVTVEVEADGRVHSAMATGINKKVAKKLAAKEVLVILKRSLLTKVF